MTLRLRAMCVVACLSFAGCSLFAQSFQPVPAVNPPECDTYFWDTSCQAYQTDRLSRSYTISNLDAWLFANPSGIAAHCVAVEHPSQICERSVSLTSDPGWGRIVWGQPGGFLKAYGSPGSGAGQFRGPAGVAISRLEGEYHVGFIADAAANRVAVVAFGFTCKCEQWMGVLTGQESGSSLRSPQGVAWDHGSTWSLSDDRVFVLDTGNDRVLVYQVSLNPSLASMSSQYLGSFGSSGTASDQLRSPRAIAVQTIERGGWLYTDVYVGDSGNERVVHWRLVTSSTSTLGTPEVRSVSQRFDGSGITGLTLDNFSGAPYGTFVFADWKRNKLIKLRTEGLSFLKEYGGGTTWAAGNFISPRDVTIITAYQQPAGSPSSIVTERLPYLSTVEMWTDTTGIQVHRLGVDVDSATVVKSSSYARDATLSFLFTASGHYSAQVKRSGTLIRQFPTTIVLPGWQTVYWDGRNDAGILQGAGAYEFIVTYESAYTYDNGAARVTPGIPFYFYDALSSVVIDGPSLIVRNQQNTWEATHVGGVSPVEYSWYRRATGFDPWEHVGTTKFYSYTHTDASCIDFELKVDLLDAVGGSGTATKSVSSDREAQPYCLELRMHGAAVSAAPQHFFLRQSIEPEVISQPRLGLSRYDKVSVQGAPPAAAASVAITGIRGVAFGIPEVRQNVMPRLTGPNTGTAIGKASRQASGTERIVLRILNSRGRLVRVAIQEQLSPGYYQYFWDGRDEAGNALPPGLYVAVLTASGFHQTAKLVLTK